MDSKIRQFLNEAIALVNSHQDIPLEAKRLALESVVYICEKEVNKLIDIQNEQESARMLEEMNQLESQVNGGDSNAENILEN